MATLRVVGAAPSFRRMASSLLRQFSAQNTQDGGKKPTTPTNSDKDDDETVADPYLPPWPDGVNPHTGERGGPRGPEPTRYGDWERKGRVSDF